MRTFLASILLVAACGASARAQTAAGQAAFESGRQAYREGRFGAAAQAFEEAYRLDHLPGLLLNQALALRKQWLLEPQREVLERAVAAYRSYLRDWPNAPRRQEALDALDELAPLLERATPPPPEPEAPPPAKAKPAHAGPEPITAPSADEPLPPPVLVPPPPAGSGATTAPLPPPPPAKASKRRPWVLPVVLGTLGGATLIGVAVAVGVIFTRSFSHSDSPSLGTVFFSLVQP